MIRGTPSGQTHPYRPGRFQRATRNGGFRDQSYLAPAKPASCISRIPFSALFETKVFELFLASDENSTLFVSAELKQGP